MVVIKPGSNNATAIIGTGQEAGASQFNQPTDIFVTSTFVYVLDAANYRVQQWPRNGTSGITVAGMNGSAGNSSSNNTFGFSYGIHVDKDGFIYVSDQPNHRVLRFPPGSASGTVVAGNGIAGAGPSQLNGAYRIFVDETKSIFIADTYNHRIQKWPSGACSGVTVAGTGTVGTTDNQLYYPVAVLVDSNQYMYISDQFNNRVHRWLVGDCVGQCLVGCTRTYGPAMYQFYYMQSVAFDSQGAMYVSDGGNHRVQKCSEQVRVIVDCELLLKFCRSPRRDRDQHGSNHGNNLRESQMRLPDCISKIIGSRGLVSLNTGHMMGPLYIAG